MSESTDTVSVERVIAAPAERIFELLADPSRHRDIDGSGTVRRPATDAERLTLGSTFDMKMRFGVPYTMTNTVIEFEEGRRIAWQPRPKKRPKLGGRIWRYELEPLDGGTRVRETWDISQEAGMKGLIRRGRKRAAESMSKTLERIEQLVTA